MTRTRNLLIWNQTRCHCATQSSYETVNQFIIYLKFIDDYDDSNYYNDDNADEDAYNSELNPYTSYESYKKKILKEFNEDDF